MYEDVYSLFYEKERVEDVNAKNKKRCRHDTTKNVHAASNVL